MAFQLPESLDGLTVEEIDALTDEARTELGAVDLSDEASDDDIAAAEGLADAIASLSDARGVAEAAATERADKLAKLRDAAVTPEPEVAEEPEAEVQVEDEIAAEAEVITPDEIDGEPLIEEVQEKEPVLADGRTPTQRAASNALPVDFAPKKAAVALTAAADVPGFSTGQKMEGLDDVVAAFQARTKAMPKHNMATERGGVRQRFGAATIHSEFDDEALIQTRSADDDFALVQHAGDESRLKGGSLTAAIGDAGSSDAWCSPSETLYDLCEFETVEGMLDIPEFQVRRGGIRYTQGPRFDQIYNNLDNAGNTNGPDASWGFHVDPSTPGTVTGGTVPFTVTSRDGSGTGTVNNNEKPCAMVECEPFQELRLECLGLCVKSPILMEMTYPELIRRFLEGVMVGHRHNVNAWKINEIATAAGNATKVTPKDAAGDHAIAGAEGRTVFNLMAVEYYAMNLRHKYRLPLSRTMEVIAPAWLKEIIRMDIAQENYRSNRCVTDQEIDSFFACRNIRVQWVYDWQELDTTTNVDHAPKFPNLGGTAAGEHPESVRLLMYPAGSWAMGVGGEFNIDAVYDAASLKDNVYTAAFMEECFLMVNRCYETIALDVGLCNNGKGVIDNLANCLVP